MQIIDFFIIKKIFETPNIYNVYENLVINKDALIKNKKFISEIINRIPIKIRKICKIKKRHLKIKILNIQETLNDDLIFKKLENLELIENEIKKEDSYIIELISKDKNYISDFLKKLQYIKENTKSTKNTNNKLENNNVKMLNDLKRIYHYNEIIKSKEIYNLSKIILDHPKLKIFFNDNIYNISENELISKILNSKIPNKENNEYICNFLDLYINKNNRFKELYLYYDNLTYEKLDELLCQTIKDFSNIYFLDTNNNEFIFKNRFGISPYKKITLDSIGQKLKGLSRERIRQIEEKIINNFIKFMNVHPSYLKKMFEITIVNSENLEEKLPYLKKIFENDMYYFLSKISEYKEMESELFPDLSMNIFEEHYSLNKSPYTYSEIEKVILDKTSIKEHLIKRSIDNLIEKNFLFKKGDLIDIGISTKSAVLSNYLLNFIDGISTQEIIKIIKNEKGFLLNKSAFYYNNYTYLYGKGVYRHINYFFEQFNDEKIENILSKVNIILLEKETDIKLKDLHFLIKKTYLDLNYFDLRFMISYFGISKNIYFDGKSGYDLISLNKIDGHNIKQEMTNFIKNRGKKLFSFKDICFNNNYSIYSLNMLLSILSNELIVLKVDSENYILSEYAFEDLNVNLIKSEIGDFLKKQNDKPFTISYIEEKMNKKFNINFHKNYYLSFLKYYNESYKINFKIIDNNLITFKKEHDKSLSKMITLLLEKYNYKNQEEIINILLKEIDGTLREIKTFYSWNISKIKKEV